MNHVITFAPLEFEGSCVHVRWRVDPPTDMYVRDEFTIDYGEALDPRALPLKLWWTIVILTLHSHWNLLRPCRIVFPVGLPENEIEFWQRLLDSERTVLERFRGTTDFARTIEIVGNGPVLEVGMLPPANAREASAYSGGKDSLLQAALLAEFGERPLLVQTRSPMPPLRDHTSVHLDRALREMAQRRDVEVAVVRSDLRTLWPHYEWPRRLGYIHSLGELTDMCFYMANLLAVAAGRGIRSLWMARELEGLWLDKYHGRTLQHFHFGYDQITLSSLDRLFQPWGVRVASLISNFSHYQVEYLIRKRYPDLADLQISCFWMEDDAGRACSRCLKCFRVGVILLSMGQDPASLGIDVDTLFEAQKDYPVEGHYLSHESMAVAAAQVKWRQVRRFFPAHNWRERLGLARPKSWVRLQAIQKRIAPLAPPWVLQSHPEYYKYISPSMRAPLEALCREYWPEEGPADPVNRVELIDTTVAWLTAPLEGEP